MDIDSEAGRRETEAQQALFERFDGKLPAELERQRQALDARLAKAPKIWRVETPVDA